MKQRAAVFSLILALLLAGTIALAATPQQESAGEFVDDTVITTKVKSAILADPTLKSFEIKVVTEKGVVQLSGFVSTQANITRAAEIARGVKGVKSVENDMRLK
ncbi:BON domain-containing protein [Fundidesulfovibrio putealis]|uniref:BON domain-containing protein n=1 Tax=Fundidesulfovibrio putealis TaxID=270496 RepID=UPI000487743C|nr:BON domain-containing protein [Fundidesulfovibrio putealis]